MKSRFALSSLVCVLIKHTLFWFTDDLPRRRPPQIYKPPTAEMIAYLDFSVSTTGMLTGVKVRRDDNLLNYCSVCAILSFLLYSMGVCVFKSHCLLLFTYYSHHLTAALFSEDDQQNYTPKMSDFIATFCLLQISHAAVSALCRSIKLQCELYSSRQIAICLDPYCGLGFVLWCLARYGEASRRYVAPVLFLTFTCAVF